MAEKPLRVRLDLTEVNLLPYKYVWVPVLSRELRTIEDFKSTLYQKFNFIKGKELKLFVQDSLLLDKETVLLLREDDTVKVVYEDQVLCTSNGDMNGCDEKKAKKKKLKRGNEECDVDWPLLHSAKKCKNGSESQVSLEIPEELSTINITSATVVKNCDEKISYVNNLKNGLCEEFFEKKRKKVKKNSNSKLKDSNCASLIVEEIDSPKLDSGNMEKLPEEMKQVEKKVTFVQEPSFTNEKSTESIHFPQPEGKKKSGITSCTEVENSSEAVSWVNYLQDELCNTSLMKKKKKVKKYVNSEPEDIKCASPVLEKTGILKLDSATVIKSQKEMKQAKNKLNAAQELSLSVEKSTEPVDCLQSEKVCMLDSSAISKLLSSSDIAEASFEIVKEPEKKVTVLQGNNCRKKKRKRRRKRKVSIDPINTVPMNNDDTIKNECFELNTMQFNKANDSMSCIRKHIVFTEQSTSSEPESNESQKHIHNKVDVVNLNSYLNKFKHNKNAEEAASSSENIMFNTPVMHHEAPQVSTPDNWYDVATPINEQAKEQINVTDIKNVTFNGSICQKGFEDTKFSNLPALNSLPVVGTHIAFKVLELSDLYCPEVSDYKEGIIQSVDSHTDEMEIELVKEEVKSGRIGKFENLYPDEEPPSERIKYVKISWAALIEPKLVTS